MTRRPSTKLEIVMCDSTDAILRHFARHVESSVVPIALRVSAREKQRAGQMAHLASSGRSVTVAIYRSACRILLTASLNRATESASFNASRSWTVGHRRKSAGMELRPEMRCSSS
jgi:hypothetical protein